MMIIVSIISKLSPEYNIQWNKPTENFEDKHWTI